MYFKNPYWNTLHKIQLLQRWILVHSILYYELNSSIVSDLMFDNNCKQLKKMMSEKPKASKESAYYETFKGYDKVKGNSTFNLLNKKIIKKYLHICKSLI